MTNLSKNEKKIGGVWKNSTWHSIYIQGGPKSKPLTNNHKIVLKTVSEIILFISFAQAYKISTIIFTVDIKYSTKCVSLCLKLRLGLKRCVW